MTRFRILLFVGLIFVASPCAGGAIVQRQGSASLEVHFGAEQPRLTLADLITVTVSVEGSTALRRPIAPLELSASAPWVLVTRSADERKAIAGGRERWSLIYQFAPREAGKIVFAFPDVKYREGDTDEIVASWKPIDFTVTTQIAKADRSLIHDITDIETPTSIESAAVAWYWWGVLVAFGIALITALVVVRRLVHRSVARSPAQIALYELSRLIAMRLPEQGRSERLITLLTMLVRRYLERQYSLPARRRTTAELLASLPALTSLTATEKQFLASFLGHCEAIKFANVEMSAQECGEWTMAAREFLKRGLEKDQSRAGCRMERSGAARNEGIRILASLSGNPLVDPPSTE